MTRRLRDLFFWVRDGYAWYDRLRLLAYWLSPRVLGHRAGPPTAVRTRFLETRPIYVRSGTVDVRVLRNVFSRGDYLVPHELLGGVSTILDLGAYVGISTLYFSRRHPAASIMAVEPDAGNYACLEQNLSALPDRTRVRALRACVADVSGPAFFSNRGSHWARSIVSGDGTTVDALTMADILSRFGYETVDLLKMDIEGGERLAFKSAPEWLPRVRWILMEVHFSAMSLSDLARALGQGGRNGFLRKDPADGRWVEVTSESYSRLETGAPVLEVLIPPARRTSP